MRVNCLGVYSMTGISKKSGQPYNMAKCVIQVPCEIVANANMKRLGFGYSAKELDMEPEAVQQFSQFQFPLELDLEVGNRVSPFGLESIITGAKRPAAVARAA